MNEEKEPTIKELCEKFKKQRLNYKERYRRIVEHAEFIEMMYQQYEYASEVYGCDGDPMKLAGARWAQNQELED